PGHDRAADPAQFRPDPSAAARHDMAWRRPDRLPRDSGRQRLARPHRSRRHAPRDDRSGVRRSQPLLGAVVRGAVGRGDRRHRLRGAQEPAGGRYRGLYDRDPSRSRPGGRCRRRLEHAPAAPAGAVLLDPSRQRGVATCDRKDEAALCRREFLAVSAIAIRPAREDEYDAVTRVWLDSHVSTGLASPWDANFVQLRARIPEEIARGWQLYVADLDGNIAAMLAFRTADTYLDQ